MRVLFRSDASLYRMDAASEGCRIKRSAMCKIYTGILVNPNVHKCTEVNHVAYGTLPPDREYAPKASVCIIKEVSNCVNNLSVGKLRQNNRPNLFHLKKRNSVRHCWNRRRVLYIWTGQLAGIAIHGTWIHRSLAIGEPSGKVRYIEIAFSDMEKWCVS